MIHWYTLPKSLTVRTVGGPSFSLLFRCELFVCGRVNDTVHGWDPKQSPRTYKNPVKNGITYQPQLVDAGFLNHQQYQYDEMISCWFWWSWWTQKKQTSERYVSTRKNMDEIHLGDGEAGARGSLTKMVFELLFPKIFTTLRIMGSQNWWFGDPKTLRNTESNLSFFGSTDS